jgi:integrase
MLKAALNRAFYDDDNKIPSDAAWRKVKPFEGVGRPRQIHLDTAQSNRLINSCQGAFRHLVTAALLTGARPPHELAALKVRHFHADLGTLSVDGKTGPRDIVLTREAINFLREIIAGRAPNALLFPRDDGEPWGKNHHIRLMEEAVARAKLPEGTTVYSLRHTHASQSILTGMNLKLLAENMGTSIRMLEEHYAKFIAKSKQKLVEETGFRLGLKRGNVESMS